MARKIEPIWAYGPVPVAFWTRGENRRAFFEWLQKKLKINRPEDWYEIRTRDLARFARGGIRAYYPSVFELVTNYLPWYDWKEWLFKPTPVGFWKDPYNQRRYLDWLGEKLGYQKPEDWYQISTKEFQKNRGETLLRIFGKHAVVKIVKFYIPDYDWKDWLFRLTPKVFWEDQENIYRYFDWLGEQLGYEKPEDWYQVKATDFWSHRAGKLIQKFDTSPSLVVEFCLPDHEWIEWRFSVVPLRFWDQPENLRRYLDWLGEQLGFQEPEDWYRLRAIHFAKHHGTAVLRRFSGLCDVVRYYMPEREWHEWLFSTVPKNFWTRRENRHRYLDWLGEQLGYERPEDWYQINRSLIEKYHGFTLHLYYENSTLAVLQDYIPHYDWDEPRLLATPPRKKADSAKRRRRLEQLGKKLGFEKVEDWYQITAALLRKNGETTVLIQSGGSPSRVVMEYFPEYDWKEWMFKVIPTKFWEDPERVRAYFNWVGDRMGVEKLEDWYRVKTSDYCRHGGAKLLDHFRKSPIAVVEYCLPDHEWLEWKFTTVPPGFWARPENVRRYLDWLGEKLGFEEPKDWLRVRTVDFSENHGGAVLQRYSGICNVVKLHMPGREWHEWLFSNTTAGFWRRRENCRRYLDWLGKQLGYETRKDWYQLSLELVRQHRGGRLAEYFHESPSAILKEYMPDYDWKEWLFRTTPRGFWQKRENRRRYVQWLGEKLGLKGPEEWGNMHRNDFKRNGGMTMLTRYGPVEKLIRDVLEND